MSIPKRRFSTNPLTQSAPLVIPSRRNSVAAVRRGSRQQELEALSRSWGLPPRQVPPTVLEEDDLQSITDVDTLSVCSDITDMQDDVDPSDWFLEEEYDEEPMFTIFEKHELKTTQNDLISSTATQLDISPSEAALILQYFDWDNDKLLREYFENPEKYQQAAGLPGGATSTSSSSTSTSSTSSVITCPVCLEEKNSSEFHSLWCNHVYCLECWRDYLHQSATSLGPEIVNVHCMFPRCSAKLSFEEFGQLADPYDNKRYSYFFLKHFTESDPHMVICPNPACGNAAKYHGVGKPSDVVECHCGTRFCFSCGHEKHNPVTCEQLTTWLGQLQDDGESVAVIKATSKPCWHCGVATTRVSGCNHMVCRKEMGGCGGEWCWMCRGDWATHGPHTGGFYSCNKYETSEAKAEDDEARKYLEPEESRKRLLHYYNRYFNHDVLMKNVQKMLNDEEVDNKMVKYTDITGCSPDFYREAAELLVECRRVLKYTYVYGYYLQDGPGKSLFEYQQASAEGITERLSEMFHAPIEDIAAQPIDFVNYIRVTKKYITNLVRSVEEDAEMFDNNDNNDNNAANYIPQQFNTPLYHHPFTTTQQQPTNYPTLTIPTIATTEQQQQQHLPQQHTQHQ